MSKVLPFLLSCVFLTIATADELHPLYQLENVYPGNDVEMKVSAMTFMGNDLYVTVFTPDRTNQAPFKEGEVFRVSGLIGNSDRSKIVATRLMGGLYEPTAIANHGGKLYIGEKDKISRLEDRNGNGLYEANEKVVLIDGLSQPNFHTYTVGFGKVVKDGKTYLGGNLTTSIKIGGSREYNIRVNPETHRGSTFLLGPISGTEKPEDTDIEFVAGGYRTPNGFGIGDDQTLVVVDNQGVFNPANEFIRVRPGSFYGHYLLSREDSNIAAFQPEQVKSEIGGSRFQSPATVYLPENTVARSPAQPLMLKGLNGKLACYNGQFIIPDVTMGRITRVFNEEVDGFWQGAVFLHSGGYDPEGKTGFTAGPNRIEEGPDGNYYLGHIGHGGLWQFLGKPEKPHFGLQRLSFKKESDFPTNFNEIVAVRDMMDGLELEFFAPVKSKPDLPNEFQIEQWTYIPTNGYGGPNVGTEQLKVAGHELSADGKRLRLTIPGIRDNSPPFITKKEYTNENVGWVVHLKAGGLGLWGDEAWCTVIKHQRSEANRPLALVTQSASKNPEAFAASLYQAVCAACHSIDGPLLVGPNFKDIHGRNQTIIRDGKEVEVTIDDDYLLRAMKEPLAEHPKGFAPAMPDLGLDETERQAMLQWLKARK
jgi:cytochrome c2